MSRYNIPELTRLWALERVTADQTIGQLLQHMQDLLDRVVAIEQRIQSTRGTVPTGLSSGGQSESPDHLAGEE